MASEVITVFRSRLRPGVEEDYGTLAAKMTALAQGMPGFVDAKTFTHADGERVTVVTFEDIESHNAWKEHPAHRQAQELGRTRFYSEYSIQVGISSNSHSRMTANKPRTILITGATSGLGLCAARTLAADASVHIIGTGRSASGHDGRIELRSLDLGSMRSIETFAAGLAADLDSGAIPPLTAIIANAGVQFKTAQVTEDGFEATIGINHLGHLALIARLLPLLSRPGRIAIVASGVHNPKQLTGMPHPRLEPVSDMARPQDDRGPKRIAGLRRYSTSKLVNVLTAYALSARLADAGIVVTAFDPGLMPGTGLARDGNALERFAFGVLMKPLVLLPGASTSERSGKFLARLADGEEFGSANGQYFAIDHKRASSHQSYDVGQQERLLEESLDLLGLQLRTQPCPSKQ